MRKLKIGNTNKSKVSLEFVGCGNSTSKDFGNSSAVVSINEDALLAIDFGYTAYHAFKERYKKLPDAIYLTHVHLDHIGGLQSLFYDAHFSNNKPIKIFIHHSQISALHSIMGSLENIVAESSVNFYDAFQLTPVSDTFWFSQHKFNVFEARHHSARFSHGLSLSGRFAYTSDTKPIPEVLMTYASQGEVIFHDLSIMKQPSHTFFDELDSYPDHILSRMIFYHLHSLEDYEFLDKKGTLYVETGEVYEL
jgi:phosphoribosyl 1,2-cyclic phosphodiesterase